MGYAIRIRTTDKGAPTTLATKATLSEARAYCSQRLLRVTGTREQVLSDLAAGVLNVYSAANTYHSDYPAAGPGF